MKKTRSTVLLLLLLLLLLLPAPQAGAIGLQVLDTALPADSGRRGLGGIALHDDFTFFGGRITYSLEDNLRVFAEAGYASIDNTDIDGFSFGGGAIIVLPVDLSLPLAARAAINYGFLDSDINPLLVSAIVFTSAEVSEGITLSGGGGLAYLDNDFKDGDTELMLTVGVEFPVSDTLRVYGEVSHIEDIMFGGGLSFPF